MRRFLCVLGMLAAAHPVAAQSIYSAAGLGAPSDPADGRARALGSFGIGLWGNSINPHDPGATALLTIPTAVMVAQPSWVDFDSGGEIGSFRGTRFPMVGIGYPLAGGVASMTLGSFMDQHFEGERDVTITLPDSTLSATDIFEQDGSISNLTLGFARRLGPSAAVGVNLGRYAGSVLRRLSRDFGGTSTVAPFDTGGRWSYSGTSLTGGVVADLNSIIRVAGSVTWSGTLDATASEDTDAGDRSFDVPLQLRVGASAVLAPGLRIAASAVRADWSGTAEDFVTPLTVGSANGIGVGIELSRARFLGRAAPLRLGYRRVGLPFSLGDDEASESVWSGGIGVALSQVEDLVLAGFDFALERGTRSDASFEETFWRATLSLKVSGF